MTEEAAEIQRLDYSKPPLGYLVHDLNDDGCTSPYETEAEAVAAAWAHAAWAHYKAHNDPPGVPLWAATLLVQMDLFDVCITGGADDEINSRIRAAAWPWYDRRLALADRLVAQFHEDQRPAWPHILAWPDDRVAEVERKLDGNTLSEWR